MKTIRDIEINVPFPVDSKSQKISYTYLDTTGRPTFTFTKKNVVDQYSQPITVLLVFIILR